MADEAATEAREEGGVVGVLGVETAGAREEGWGVGASGEEGWGVGGLGAAVRVVGWVAAEREGVVRG